MMLNKFNQSVVQKPPNTEAKTARIQKHLAIRSFDQHEKSADYKLQSRYMIMEQKDLITTARQVSQFLLKDSSSLTETKIKQTSKARQEMYKPYATISAQNIHPHTLSLNETNGFKSNNKMPTTNKTTILKNILSRDVSYMLDQSRLKKIVTQDDLYKAIGIIESSTPEKFPDTLSELNKVRLTLKNNDPNQNIRLLIKNDIFKQIPIEFLEKTQEFFADSLTSKLQKDIIYTPKGEVLPPNRNCLGPPSSRYDAVALLNWLDSMLFQLSSKHGIRNDDKFELAQILYYFCYKELIRQVSVQCLERGILIWKLWRAYFVLIENVDENAKQNLIKQEENCVKKINEINQLCEQKIQEMKDKIENTKIDCELSKRSLEEENNELKTQNSKLASNIRKGQDKIEELEYHNSKLENYRIKYKNMKTFVENQKIEYEEALEEKEAEGEKKGSPKRHISMVFPAASLFFKRRKWLYEKAIQTEYVDFAASNREAFDICLFQKKVEKKVEGIFSLSISGNKKTLKIERKHNKTDIIDKGLSLSLKQEIRKEMTKKNLKGNNHTPKEKGRISSQAKESPITSEKDIEFQELPDASPQHSSEEEDLDPKEILEEDHDSSEGKEEVKKVPKQKIAEGSKKNVVKKTNVKKNQQGDKAFLEIKK